MKHLNALLLFLAVAGTAQAGVLDGLLNYYNLDGDFNDTAGSLTGNSSTFDDHGEQPEDSVSFANASAAGLGQYGVFNGDEFGYIEVPDSDDISLAGFDLSISAWVNVNQFDQGWQAVVAHGESTDYRIARRGGNSNILSYAGGAGDIPGDDTTGPNVNDGAWHHVVSISPDGAPVELWVDGVQVATGANAALTDNGSGRLMIGGNPDTAGDGFRTWDGGIDEVAMWDRPLLGEEIGQIFTAGVAGIALPGVDDFAGALPPFDVAGRDMVGSNDVEGAYQNIMLGEASGSAPGLGQSWYAVANPGSKEGVDAVAVANDRLVPYFHAEGGTWWSGANPSLDGINDYPPETGGTTVDNYTVKLDGEIMIEESGTISFLDGVDDYTYLAIDTDRSGVAGDTEEEVLINDNSWTNAVSVGNGGAPIVTADFEDIADGGEWLAIEFNMAEGGGGDAGILYWDFNDEDEVFPLDQGEGVDPLDASFLMIPDTHLRGPESPAPVLGGEFAGAVASRESGWEIDVNPADGTSDSFALANPDDALYTTILDVDGIEFHINPLSDASEGDTFQILDADSIVGTPIIATEGWSFDPATGSVVFGMATGCNPNSMGDLDGNGTVEFADFLTLSQNFGQAVADHTSGDIDCNGTVEFADFLALSQSFGQAVGGAQSVPEPSALALLGFGGLFVGLLRRRRS